MAIQWTPKLAVGVPLIDEQHQELFSRVNHFLERLGMAKGKEELQGVVSFLGGYVGEHFGAEARLMRQHGFPDTAAHLAQHDFFVKEFGALAAELEKTGPTSLLTIKLNKLLCDWLRDHVAKTDRALGDHLQAVKAAARA
jgi:hemerythrin